MVKGSKGNDDETPELAALLDMARYFLHQSWRVNGNNKLIGTRLETVVIALKLANHDTAWIDTEWHGSYLGYKSVGGRGTYFSLLPNWTALKVVEHRNRENRSPL